MTEAQSTDITALPPADRALIVLNSTKTELDLRNLAQEAASVTEVKDSAGREQAHRLGMRLKTARTTIEKAAKAAREDAQAFSKAVITEEKRLIGITETEEKRVLGLRDSFDAKAAAEKAAKEAAERARVDEIKGKIQGIRDLPRALANDGSNSEAIELERLALIAFEPPPDVFGEFTDECKAAIAEAAAELETLFSRVKAQEIAAATLKAEQEKLAAERAAIEAERAALAAERAALAAAKAEVTAVAVEDTAIAEAPAADEPAQMTLADEYDTLAEELEDAPAASDWTVRQIALITADQFSAFAAKVEACGAAPFANELQAVAYGLREGDYDGRIAEADRGELLSADYALMNAASRGIDILRERTVEAAE